MKQLSRLIIAAIVIVLSAGGALAAAPDDPFAKADATVKMCTGLLPLTLVVIMVVVLVRRARDKRNKNSLPKTAETIDGENDGNTAEIIAASDAAPGNLDDAGPQSQASSEPQKKTVAGFAKAWIIFWIVGNLASTCAPINRLSDSGLGGIVAVFMLLAAAVTVGYILLYYKNPIGLYLILIANILAMLMNNVRVPGYSISVTTGLVIGIITYFVTRKQVAYPFGRPPVTGRTTGAAFRAPAVAESLSLIRGPQPDNGQTPADADDQQSAILALGSLDDPNASPSSSPAELSPSVEGTPASSPDPVRAETPWPSSDAQPGSVVLPAYTSSAYTPTAETSRLAIASLAAGIATWLIIPLIGAIAAVVTGHLARKRIRQDPEHLSGSGLAIAGLVLGYTHLGLVLLIAATSGFALIAARPHSGGSAPATALPALAASAEPASGLTTWSPTVESQISADAPASTDGSIVTPPASDVVPEAGHWEGEPSVSFEVTNDGVIRDFSMRASMGMDTCAITANEIPIEADHTFAISEWRELTDGLRSFIASGVGRGTVAPATKQFGSGEMVESKRIAGQFDTANTLTGSYLITQCEDRIQTVVKVPTWNAEWKGASDPSASTTRPAPTSSPAATATPAPTTTAVAAVAAPVSLADALAQNLADIRILGKGGASGSSILLLVRTTTGQKPGTIKVEPGTVLRSSLAGEQDMVVRRLLGWQVDEQHYNPAETLFLTGIEGTQTYVVDAYCLNFHKDNPSAGNSFTLDGMTEPAISAILQAVERMPGMDAEIAVIQAAIWAMTDNPTWTELAERGYSPDHERVRALLKEARLDPTCTTLFGGQCAQTPQASGQGTQPAPSEATPEPRATTTILDAQVQKFFAPGPNSGAIAVAGDAIWVADGTQRRIHHLDRNGAPMGSFQVKAEGEFRGLAWDGEALRLLVSDYSKGNRVLRLDTQGNVLSSVGMPVELKSLSWDPVDQTFWAIPSQANGFLLELNADGSLQRTLPMPVFGGAEAVAWAPDGLWVLNVFGTWHRFTFGGVYLASAKLPVEVFAGNPALAWDPQGYLWLSVPEAREIHRFSLREAAVEAKLPPEMQSTTQQQRSEGQFPLPPVVFRPAAGSANALAQVVNSLPATLAVALDSDQGGQVHESGVLAPGETWSAIVPQGGVFTLFLSANAAPPVAYSDKVLLLPGYEYTWTVGNAVAANPGAPAGHGSDTATPRPTATEAPSPTATSSPPAVTAAPTLSPTRAAPTRAPTRPRPTSAPSAACADPRVRITYPANGATISGVTNFIGTVALPDQVYYKFEYKPASSPTWQFLTQFNDKAVMNDKLMDFFTTTIAPGVYDFRLIAVDRSGNYPPPCEIRLTVQR